MHMKRTLLSIIFSLCAFFAFSGVVSAENINTAVFNFEDLAKRTKANFTTLFYTADRGITENRDIAEIKVVNGPILSGWVVGA